MSWSFHPASDSFDQYRERWDAINRLNGNHILLDSAFVGLLLRHFGSPGVVLGIRNDPNSPGIALLERARGGFWQTFQPSQAPLGLILLGSRDQPRRQIDALLRALPGYALGLAVLQQDVDFTPFAEVAPGPDVERIEHILTARLTFAGTFEQYWNSRDRHFVKDLGRRRRRLAERGTSLELVVERRPEQVAEAIRQYGLLEAAGWKSTLGTAISPDNQQGALYRELLEHFCNQKEGVIYRLLLDGRTAAANLCLERGGMLVVLKTTYDEGIQSFSPGHLLDQEMRRSIFAEGRIRVEEYYGPFSASQAKWTDDVRAIFHLNFFRSPAVVSARSALRAARTRLDRFRSLLRPSAS